MRAGYLRLASEVFLETALQLTRNSVRAVGICENGDENAKDRSD
jgi:hypothetical protein